MSELTSMMNIGKEMERKLTSVGIDSPVRFIILNTAACRKTREKS